MSFVPLHVHSDYSFLDSASKASQIADRISELGYSACALTDHGNLSGVPAFIKSLSKKKIKPIAGCEFYICQQDSTIKEKENSALSHLCVLGRGKEGWQNLVKASSESFKTENFYRKPRLSIEQLSSFSKGHFITFSGHMGSELANLMFEEPKYAYNVNSVDDVKDLLKKKNGKWDYQPVFDLIAKYKELFGPENFFVEIQLIDQDNLPASKIIAEGLRWAAKKTNTPCIATADSHYCRKEDAVDQRVLLCTAFETTLRQIQEKINNGEDVALSTFFRSNNYHIPSLEEMEKIHTKEELENTVKIAERCQAFKIDGQPLIAKVSDNPNQRVKELCQVGWDSKIKNIIPSAQIPIYEKRLKKEINVVERSELSDYFLVVNDYCKWALDQGIKLSPGRGSSAGSLLAYLIDITQVDPIKYDLLFERFINSSRFYTEHVDFKEYGYLDFMSKEEIDSVKELDGNLVHPELTSHQFYEEELNRIKNNTKLGLEYYQHIINNVEIDRSNPNNSFVMMAYGKVDSVDLESPAKFIDSKIALPDIDTDFQSDRREEVIAYIKNKYGKDYVSQIGTFSRMQGREAMKSVLRVHERCSFEEMNKITEYIPDEAEIADELQEMREETGEASIIKWALLNNSKKLSPWCTLKNGKLEGSYALEFGQAIRLEGTKRNMGKHASGLIICSERLNDIFPMVQDKKTGESLVGVDYREAEMMGGIKFDVLSTSILSKSAMAERMICGL